MEILELKNSLCAVLSCFGRVWLFVTLWTAACQVPLSLGFSRQEYWSGLPCPLPTNLPFLGIEPSSLVSSALAYRCFTTSASWEALKRVKNSWREFMWNVRRKNPWIWQNDMIQRTKRKHFMIQLPKARSRKAIFKRGKEKFTLYKGNNNTIYC